MTEDTRTDADEVDETAPAEVGETAEQPTGRGPLASKRFLIATAAATVALIAAVAFGLLWWSAKSGTEYEVASGRDAAAAAAREGVLAYTAIDYKNPDNYRNSQRAISTDDLYDQMKQGWSNARKQIVESQLRVKVSILKLGVSKIDTHQGDAEVVAAIKISRAAKGEQEQSGLMRMVAKLKRVGEEWKLADIAEAPEFGSA